MTIIPLVLLVAVLKVHIRFGLFKRNKKPNNVISRAYHLVAYCYSYPTQIMIGAACMQQYAFRRCQIRRDNLSSKQLVSSWNPAGCAN